MKALLLLACVMIHQVLFSGNIICAHEATSDIDLVRLNYTITEIEAMPLHSLMALSRRFGYGWIRASHGPEDCFNEGYYNIKRKRLIDGHAAMLRRLLIAHYFNTSPDELAPNELVACREVGEWVYLSIPIIAIPERPHLLFDAVILLFGLRFEVQSPYQGD